MKKKKIENKCGHCEYFDYNLFNTHIGRCISLDSKFSGKMRDYSNKACKEFIENLPF